MQKQDGFFSNFVTSTVPQLWAASILAKTNLFIVRKWCSNNRSFWTRSCGLNMFKASSKILNNIMYVYSNRSTENLVPPTDETRRWVFFFHIKILYFVIHNLTLIVRIIFHLWCNSEVILKLQVCCWDFIAVYSINKSYNKTHKTSVMRVCANKADCYCFHFFENAVTLQVSNNFFDLATIAIWWYIILRKNDNEAITRRLTQMTTCFYAFPSFFVLITGVLVAIIALVRFIAFCFITVPTFVQSERLLFIFFL